MPSAATSSSVSSRRHRRKQPKFIIVNPGSGYPNPGGYPQHHVYPPPSQGYPQAYPSPGGQYPLQCTCHQAISPVHCPQCRPISRPAPALDLDRCLDSGLKCLGAPFSLLGNLCETTWNGMVRGCTVVGTGLDSCYATGVDACLKTCDACGAACDNAMLTCGATLEDGFAQCNRRVEKYATACETRVARTLPPPPRAYPAHVHHGCPIHDPHSRCRTCGRNVMIPTR